MHGGEFFLHKTHKRGGWCGMKRGGMSRETKDWNLWCDTGKGSPGGDSKFVII